MFGIIKGPCLSRVLQLHGCGTVSIAERHIFRASWVLGNKSKNKGYRNRKEPTNVATVDGCGRDILSPSAIQVFSDPHLAQTVRDLAVSFQKTKNAVKNLREDLEDCTFELLRQGQNNESLETAVRETTKLLKQCNEHDVVKIGETMKELEENVVYFSKLAANQENRLMDMNDNIQSSLSKLAHHSSSISGLRDEMAKLKSEQEKFKTDSLQELRDEMGKLKTENETFRAEATTAFVDSQITKKEMKSIKGELAYLKKK